ncbi:hypothetical protein [Streptomyces cyaneofuscatus]|uniref:hypothetical protein n=1 Tax=Streptomyces TaxID=1883 RepID=UPI002E15920B|nr:hypothetical protein OG366_20835 [Streptomyces cyaneofuscatus]WTF36236.1 hypothetical protein OG973_15935 [Streptomyces cyaneofuscatus]
MSGARPTRTAFAALLGAVAVMSLTGGCSEDWGRCGPDPVAEVLRADLYGTYKGPHGAGLTLRSNGDSTVSFSADNWPEENGPEILKGDARTFEGRGSWRITGDPGEDDSISLHFEDRPANRPGQPLQQLQVGKEDGRLVLFAKLGDPDVCRVYELKQ